MTTRTALQVSDIHPIHPFPARMAPSIVWDSLPNDGRQLNVFDPMSGSGTTLVSARAKGHQAIGCDTDPLALLIARSWCSDIIPKKLRYRAELVIDRAKRLSENITPEEAYPSNADQETREFLNYWFDNTNRIQLAALSICIKRVRNTEEKDLLWCAFSRLIITKKVGVSLAMDVSHSRPHRVYEEAPIRAFGKFLQAVDYIIKKAPFIGNNINGPGVILKYGDARGLPIEDSSVDMIITSPPYLNAIDYIRGHKFSLVWMGYSIESLRSLRTQNIGSEHAAGLDATIQYQDTVEQMVDIRDISKRYHKMMLRYVGDMDLVFSECRRVLKPDGQAFFVIGNSSVAGVFVRNSEGLINLANNHGFTLVSSATRPLPENRRYLPPPNFDTSGERMQNRMREEVILKFS